ncbi:MAG: hypothetical protein OEW88_10640 [Gammaproteobacteria bacterium]|nr:hypothetical protein [Gammaproteobacteria bacterium]
MKHFIDRDDGAATGATMRAAVAAARARRASRGSAATTGREAKQP